MVRENNASGGCGKYLKIDRNRPSGRGSERSRDFHEKAGLVKRNLFKAD
jgi:hypothetical protein